jgi:hypothetical protein
MIEGISAVTLCTHEMPRAVRFYRALGFEVLHGGAIAPSTVVRPYALQAPLGMAGRFKLLLDGNREQRPSETEFVAVGVN